VTEMTGGKIDAENAVEGLCNIDYIWFWSYKRWWSQSMVYALYILIFPFQTAESL
jgi:hypothetical protein